MKPLIVGLALVAALAACSQPQPAYSPVNGVGGKVDGGARPANIPSSETQPLTVNPKGPLGP